jgi:protein involved in polysaccharide export with SLBB domain
MLHVIFALLCAQNSVFLLPSDAVEIKIWRQEDLSGWYIIDADTNLHIPLLGRLPVGEIATDSLHSYLVNTFKDYYADVVVEINFYYRINVFGEVMQPGHYYVKHGDNLTNLLAQAGGPTNDGTLGGIRILNIGSERTVDFERIMKSGEDMEQLYLQPGDVVIVPRRFMAAFQEWTVFLSAGTLLLQIYLVASQ